MLPKRKNGYEAIPDAAVAVTTANGDDRSSSAATAGPSPPSEEEPPSPQERYPEANPDEAELLGLLDEFVKDCTVAVSLPTVSVHDFNDKPKSSACVDFVRSLLIPTLCSLIMAGAAVWIGTCSGGDSEHKATSYVAVFFPYAAAIIVLLGSAVPIRRRCTYQARQIYTRVHPTKDAATKAVRDVATSVSQKVALVRMKLEEVVDFMRPKLKKASKSEKRLKKMDPTIVIPSPDDVFRELDGAEEEVRNLLPLEKVVVGEMEDSFVEEWLPPRLRSVEAYRDYVLRRAVVACLVLHLVAVHLMVLYYPMDERTTAAQSRTRFMTSKVSRRDESTAFSGDILDLIGDAWPDPLILVAEVYLMAILQLAIVFVSTSASSTVAVVSRMRSTVTERTNLLLRQHGVTFLCRDILERRMELVKAELLDRIRFIYKLSMLMEIVEEDCPPSPSKHSSPPSSPRRRPPPGMEQGSSPDRTSARKMLKNLWTSSSQVDEEEEASDGAARQKQKAPSTPTRRSPPSREGSGTPDKKSFLASLRAVPDS